MPKTLSKALDDAVAAENRAYIRWQQANPDNCPHCLQAPDAETGCFVCDPDRLKLIKKEHEGRAAYGIMQKDLDNL